MGCTSTREKLESKMLVLKLERVLIKQERKKMMKDLEELVGGTVKRVQVPDYIDPTELRRIRSQMLKDTKDDENNSKDEETNRRLKKDISDNSSTKKRITLGVPYEAEDKETKINSKAVDSPVTFGKATPENTPQHKKIVTFASSNLLLNDNATHPKKENDINNRYLSGSTEHKKSTSVDEDPRIINLSKPKTPIKKEVAEKEVAEKEEKVNQRYDNVSMHSKKSKNTDKNSINKQYKYF